MALNMAKRFRYALVLLLVVLWCFPRDNLLCYAEESGGAVVIVDGNKDKSTPDVPSAAASSSNGTPDAKKELKSWAVLCLAMHTGNYTERNNNLASMFGPYAASHNITFVFFGEHRFPDASVMGWKKSLSHVGSVVIIDTRKDGWGDPRSKRMVYGYKYMCKFYSIDMYRYISEYDYYMRVDTDVTIQKMEYDLMAWVEDQNLEYAYGTRKIEAHEPTQRTLPVWIEKYVDTNSLTLPIKHPSLHICWNFYNNFHIAKVSFFQRDDVRAFLAAVMASGGVLQHRWGDSTIEAYVVRLFMEPEKVKQIPNFRYYHGSHRVQVTTVPNEGSKRIAEPGKSGWTFNELPEFNWTQEENEVAYNIAG
jgi:hypothetical protein